MPRRRTEADGLTAKQRAAALCLARGLSRRAAARKCGAGVRTLYDWSEQPEFAAEVERCRAALFRAAADRLAGLQELAIRAVRKLLTSETTGEAVRLGAARLALEHALKTREALDIAGRLDALETLARSTK